MATEPSRVEVAGSIARLTVFALTPQKSATSSTVIGRSVIAGNGPSASRWPSDFK